MTKVEELLLEAIKERYEFELDRIQRLDNKAYNILGIAGVLATLTSGLASLSITVTLNVLGIVIISVFILCICMLLYSFYLGLKA